MVLVFVFPVNASVALLYKLHCLDVSLLSRKVVFPVNASLLLRAMIAPPTPPVMLLYRTWYVQT